MKNLKLVQTFIALSAVKSELDLPLLKKVQGELCNIRKNRFLKLVELSVICYKFRVYFNSSECKELRKKKKLDVTMEDVINVTFSMTKAYFYRLATMGKYVTEKPEKLKEFITKHEKNPTEYVMDATTFNDFCSGKVKDPVTKPVTKDEQESSSESVTESIEAHDRELLRDEEEKDNNTKEIVFQMLHNNKGVTIYKHKQGGNVTELHNIEPSELQQWLQSVTKVIPNIMLDAKRYQPFGVTHYLDTKSKKWITDYGNIKLTKQQREIVTQSIKNHS